MTTQSYLFLANGFEEIEALATVDIMRRAGMKVDTVSITDRREVTGANGITVVADRVWAGTDFTEAEWLITPGGMPGASNLSEFAPLCELLKNHAAAGGKIAAICAAPAVVLGQLGLLKDKDATCYPGFESMLGGTHHKDEAVVALPTVITANGPASAVPFALAIVANTLGEEKAHQIGTGLLYYSQESPYFF